MRLFRLALALLVLLPCLKALAEDPNPGPDVLVFTNGDQLTGKLVREVAGTVTFHSDMAGDINLGWDKVKELRSSGNFAVLVPQKKARTKPEAVAAPRGQIHVTGGEVEVAGGSGTAAQLAPIPVANAQYIIDETTFNREVLSRPGLLQGWSGPATAGATIVAATQNQYTFNGALALVRIVPTVDWLQTRNRTSIDFSGSFGKITQPAYIAADGTLVPSTATKSAIYHANAERDQYFSPRFFALVQAAFDHNFSLRLDLQQIYGAGIGWTALRTPNQQLDLKATLQYEKQLFLSSPGVPATGLEQNLIGSTFNVSYGLKLPKGIAFAQQLSFIPSYNVPRAYSANETDTLLFPVYRGFGLTVGTIDSYLNNPPAAAPVTRRNSFQFTTGITYNIKSNY